MPRPFAPASLRLRAPADLLAAIPHQFGFTPAESIVVSCLHGSRQRAGLMLRFDLPHPEDSTLIAAEIGSRVRVSGANGVFLAVFSEDTEAAGDHLPHAGFVDDVCGDLPVRLVEAVLTDGRRWWSYTCSDRCCGGREGRAIDLGTPGATSVAAAFALTGRTVLPDRESMVRSLDIELVPEDVPCVLRRIDAATDRLGGLDRGSRRARVRELATRLMRQCQDPREPPTDDDLADLVALCADVVVRDEVLVLGLDDAAREQLLPILRTAVRRVPPPHDAPVCTMFGMLAYAEGNGLLAGVALARALRTDPDYSLAALMADALSRQVPPDLVEDVIQAAADDLCKRDTAG